MDGEPRLGEKAPGSAKVTLFLAVIFVSPFLLPFASVNGEPRFESSDFGVLDELNQMLDERESFIDSNEAVSYTHLTLQTICSV